MIVIVASRTDKAARALLERWSEHQVAQLTPQDLSTAGWRYQPNDPARSIAVLGGRQVAVSQFGAVVTRLPWVVEQELGHIRPSDRSYVAAEMTAFLLAWLASLPCPVLNRPTPRCLAGPFWRPEQWVHLAATLGIPIRRHCSASHGPADGWIDNAPAAPTAMTVIGPHCVGTGSVVLAGYARRLAAAAGADLLAVTFSHAGPDAQLINAHPWPDIAARDVADTLLAHLQQRADQRNRGQSR